MANLILHLRGIALSFGGRPVLDGAELTLSQGERLCVVGRNGSGKSTLLRVAAGLIEPDRGEAWTQPGTTLRYLPQEPDLSGHADVLSYVEAGLGPSTDHYRARYLLESLGLTAKEAPDTLSGGERRRAAIARALAPEPDVLLLDEPTNHLDIAAIQLLEDELEASRSALILISHDRRFLETLSTATLWLDRGISRRMERGFAGFETWRDKTLEEEETQRHKLDRKIEREEDWLRYGVTARRKRNVKRLAGLGELRRSRREAVRAVGQANIAISESDISGKLVIEAKGVSKSFDGRPVISNVSLTVLRGDRLAIVGPNGAGKTTLLRLLLGTLAPDAGTVRRGAGLDTIVLEQGRDSLDPEDTLANAISGGRGDTVLVNGVPRHVASYMKDFLFRSGEARTPVGVLSGGERARILLARAFATASNLMVLDEPTNDLDLETLDLLEEKIAAYSGTVLLVSHDRDFIDRIATSTLANEAQGRWIEYAGGYADMLAQRGSSAGLEKPKPVKAIVSQPESRPEALKVQRKLSFKEKHALETLPLRIEALEAEITALERTLADAGLFTRDPRRFEASVARLASARAGLAQSEDEWLRLDALKDGLSPA